MDLWPEVLKRRPTNNKGGTRGIRANTNKTINNPKGWEGQ